MGVTPIKGRDMIRISRKLVTAAVAIGAFAMVLAGPASAATPSYTIEKGAYGKRYCELMLVKIQPSAPLLHIQVWNTFGLNDCPTAGWNAATTSAALTASATANGMDTISVNGPRWWAFNRIGGVLGTSTKMFGTVGMRQAAVLDLNAAPTPFVELTVHRTSTWIYDKGTYIRELISPSGKKYGMQAWTTQVSTKVTEKSLNTLATGKKPLLVLPAGWKYKAIKLTKQLTVVAPGTMTVIQDNLKNTYSLLP